METLEQLKVIAGQFAVDSEALLFAMQNNQVQDVRDLYYGLEQLKAKADRVRFDWRKNKHWQEKAKWEREDWPLWDIVSDMQKGLLLRQKQFGEFLIRQQPSASRSLLSGKVVVITAKSN